jgi:hypothetical protein
MKQTILDVLDRYKDTQLNLASEACREMIADEIQDEIKSKYIFTPLEETAGTGWVYDGDID